MIFQDGDPCPSFLLRGEYVRLKCREAFSHRVPYLIQALGTRATAIDDPYLPDHYGTINVAHYLNQGEAWISIGVVMTAQTDDYLVAGRGIGEAIARSDRRVVLLASGSMSHSFYPMKELLNYESSDPKYIFTPEARAADLERIDWFYEGNHAAVLDTMPGVPMIPSIRYPHSPNRSLSSSSNSVTA